MPGDAFSGAYSFFNEGPNIRTSGDVNGYEFDGATQFMYVNFVDTLKALRYE